MWHMKIKNLKKSQKVQPPLRFPAWRIGLVSGGSPRSSQKFEIWFRNLVRNTELSFAAMKPHRSGKCCGLACAGVRAEALTLGFSRPRRELSQPDGSKESFYPNSANKPR
jgi:hypothetical protein